MEDDYRTLREQAYHANAAVRDAGLVVLTWGNASAADHEKGVFAIKPSGVEYDELSPEAIVVVSIETGEVVWGRHRPSSDTATHRRIFEAFPGVGGVVHTHSFYATAFAQAGTPIPCMGTTHADHFAGPVPVTRHPTQAEIEAGYETATGDIIADYFTDNGIDPLHVPAVLLPHHGPFAWGKDADEAVKNAIVLEAVARIASYTYAITATPPAIPDRLQNKHFERKHGPNAYYGQER
ncbi:MAG: L-ribulose-5-phosphate 4-epimerase AraD [Spirochaetota bacterium]